MVFWRVTLARCRMGSESAAAAFARASCGAPASVLRFGMLEEGSGTSFGPRFE